MDAHRVLGVAMDASEEQIRRAYKAMAMKWHPDRRPQEKEAATEKFVEISKASRALLRNLRRARRSATMDSTATSDPQSSPRSPPAVLPKSNTFQSTRSSSQFSSTSNLGSSFSFFSSSSPSLSTSISEHQVSHSPLSGSSSHFHKEPFPTSEDPAGSGPRAIRKTAPNRLKKQSKASSARSSSDQWDFTPKRSARRKSPRQGQDPWTISETLCPGRGILSGAGADSPKKWVHELPMTLEELFHGMTYHFTILRYTTVGKKSYRTVDIIIPPGAHAGLELTVTEAGHQGKDGKYQDITFVVREMRHYRFTRNRDDLIMEVKLPWMESLANGVGQVYLRGVDDKEYGFAIDYLSEQNLNGTTIIPYAGMPCQNGKGRGKIIVLWEIEPPSSASGSWGSLKATLGIKSRT